MIKLDIVNRVAERTGVPKMKAEQAVDEDHRGSGRTRMAETLSHQESPDPRPLAIRRSRMPSARMRGSFPDSGTGRFSGRGAPPRPRDRGASGRTKAPATTR